MDVLVKGIEMPKTCAKCRMRFVIDCNLWQRVRSISLDKHRNCPLVEVPTPHGRLIDADSLIAKHEKAAHSHGGASYSFHMAARAWVMKAPTIIEEEGE